MILKSLEIEKQVNNKILESIEEASHYMTRILEKNFTAPKRLKEYKKMMFLSR